MPASEPGAPESLHRSRWWLPLAAGLLHAALFALAFPPFGLWPAALISPVPLIWAALLPRPSRWFRSPALLVTAGVLPLHLYEHHWIIDVSGFGFFPMAVILALFSGLFVWCLSRASRRFPRLPLTLTVPVIWIGVEILRGEIVATGYGWLLLAHPLIDAPLLPRPASLIGTYGVSFLVALGCGAAADIIRKRPRRMRSAIAGVGAIVAVYIATILTAPSPADPAARMRVAVVQTNLPQDNKLEWTPEQREADFERFDALTRQAAAGSPDLIVWPETMFPGYFLDPLHIADQRGHVDVVPFNDYTPRLLDLQRELKIPMLVGALGADNLRVGGEPKRVLFDAMYNSAFLIQDGRIASTRYDKMELTPFGETFPVVWRWPWLQQKLMDFAAHGMTFELSSGRSPVVFRLALDGGKREATIGTPICFEATKPGLCRRLDRAAGNGPRALINLTNDGWFGSFDPGRWQHLQIARWRALELNVPVVRAANTGVSASIDANGGVVAEGVGVNQFARADGVLTTDILLGGAPTIYARSGDVLGWSSFVGACVLLAATLVGVRKKEPA
jgi:apolipoprotein N-acyltransferase